jgi:TonB family protein
MIGDQSKSTSINPAWIIVPLVLLLLFFSGLGLAGFFVYISWHDPNAESNTGNGRTNSNNNNGGPPQTPERLPSTLPTVADDDPSRPPLPPATHPPPGTVSGGVLNGKATSLPKPVYPAIARAAHASGQVSVQVTIDEQGSVIAASAVSGHPLLRASAVNAARDAKFSPTLLSGVPVKVTGTLVYNFTE